MRVVKFTWNQKVNADANYSLQTEVIVDDDATDEATEALGASMVGFMLAFQEGISRRAAES